MNADENPVRFKRTFMEIFDMDSWRSHLYKKPADFPNKQTERSSKKQKKKLTNCSDRNSDYQ